jgi:hypothetical protein
MSQREKSHEQREKAVSQWDSHEQGEKATSKGQP